MSAAYNQYLQIINVYSNVLPLKTFPWVPLIIAASFQVFAWFGGRLLHQYTLLPRLLILWCMAFGEYLFMSPAMNASVEILGLSESLLVVIYQVVTLLVFIIVNILVFRQKMHPKYLVSFALLSMAVYVAYMW